MTNPTPTEQAELDKIEADLAKLAKQAAPLKARKQAILARIRFRKHYAAKTGPTQS